MPADADAAVVKNEDKYVPTIDLREYFDSNSEEARNKVIEEVRGACLEHGFFQITGHGVPLEIQRGMLAAAKKLFDLPMAAKQQISLYKYSWRRGYQGPGEQQANNPHKGDFLPDVKEGFFVGKEMPLDQVDFLQGPNVWPPALAEDDFRRPVMDYYKHAHIVGHKIMELLVVSLGHSPSILREFTTNASMFLKLLKYPPQTWTDERKFNSGQHIDYGGITILLQDPGHDGLEVWHEATGQWVSIPAVEDIYVINLGDMVQRWTGGKYKSNLHRVVNKGGSERYSVPAFWHGDLHAKNVLDPNDPSEETVREFIKKKFYKAYGIANDPVA